jgi:hypothetical protein
MANLKLDLLNKNNNNKMFTELELVRLAQEPNMNYKNKIDMLDDIFDEIVMINAKAGLIEQYFQEPAPQTQPAPTTTQENVYQGQSHGE